MPLIPLIGRAKGQFAVVDDEDFERVVKHRWRLLTPQRSLTRYATAHIAGRTVLMHRLVLMPSSGLPIDHIDGDGLNNQRTNLRLVTQAENIRAGIARRAFDLYESEL